MAEPYKRPEQRETIDRRRDKYSGHEVTWDLRVSDLNLLKTWKYKKNYRTFCVTKPSTWRFELLMPEIRDDGSCLLEVFLERKDDLPVRLEASIRIDICNQNGTCIFPRQTFTKYRMLPGQTIKESAELKPNPHMRREIHEKASCIVNLMIGFCHNDSDSDSYSSEY